MGSSTAITTCSCPLGQVEAVEAVLEEVQPIASVVQLFVQRVKTLLFHL
jgi:hypothetical protein